MYVDTQNLYLFGCEYFMESIRVCAIQQQLYKSDIGPHLWSIISSVSFLTFSFPKSQLIFWPRPHSEPELGQLHHTQDPPSKVKQWHNIPIFVKVRGYSKFLKRRMCFFFLWAARELLRVKLRSHWSHENLTPSWIAKTCFFSVLLSNEIWSHLSHVYLMPSCLPLTCFLKSQGDIALYSQWLQGNLMPWWIVCLCNFTLSGLFDWYWHCSKSHFTILSLLCFDWCLVKSVW